MPGSAAAADVSFGRRFRPGVLIAWLAQRRALAFSLLLFLLALPPLLLATWGFGRALGASEVGKLDLRVTGALASVESTVRRRADGSEAGAAALARSGRLQEALRRRDLAALGSLMASHPGVQLVLAANHRTLGSLPPPPRELRRVDILAGTTSIGALVTGASYVPALGDRDGVLVVATRNGRIVAGPLRGDTLAAQGTAADARVGGRVYRATAVQVAGGQLVGLADRGPTDAAVRRRQEQIALAVLVSLGALSLGMTLVIRGRRRRADRLRSAGAVTLVENLLNAVHDPDAMLAVVLESAVAVAGAAGGELSWRGETVRRGAVASGRSSLEVALVDPQGVSAGHLALVPAGEPFDRDSKALVEAVVDRGVAALEAVQRQRVVQYQALTDELTGLANRRGFRQTLDVEIARAERSSTPLSLILADLDGFKQINDTHGHHVGDEVLNAFARVLTERVRATDVPARLGGDEFVVVLPDTALAGAVALAENLRAALLDDPALDSVHRATASFGVAPHPTGGTGEELLRAADEALYRAKRAGRDRVVAAADVVG